MTQTSTKRLYRKLQHRPTMVLAMEATAGQVFAAGQWAAWWDEDEKTRNILVVGDPPADWLSWAVSGLPDGFEPGAHYLDGDTVVLRYQTPLGPVEIHQASMWFGTGDYTRQEALDAYEALMAIIGEAFPGSTILATPATTGRELFLRSIPRGTEYPVLDAETQDLIRATDGQGRIEVVRAPWTPFTGTKYGRAGEEPKTYEMPLEGLYEYDARFAYASMCWELPVGPVHHDDVDRFEGTMRGRYKVTGMVPSDWAEPFGLIGEKDNAGGWRYPSTPRQTFKTWCDAAELDLAIKHGWRFRIWERLLFPATGRPLDTWAKKLTRARRDLECQTTITDRLSDQVAGLVQNALRAILLQSIGAFHGRPHVETHMLPLDRAGEVPAEARRPRRGGPGDNWIVYGLGTGQGWANLAHPEWSACVWGRARARLLHAPRSQGALNRAPGTHVVGFRTDAIYLTGPQPEWDAGDDGAPGRYRLKGSSTARAAWPRNGRELLGLKAGLS